MIESWGGTPASAKAGWDATTEVSAADAAMSTMNADVMDTSDSLEDAASKMRGSDLDWDNV